METCTYCGTDFNPNDSKVAYINSITTDIGCICPSCLNKNAVVNNNIFGILNDQLDTQIYALNHLDEIFEDTEDQELFEERMVAQGLETINDVPLEEISNTRKEKFLNEIIEEKEDLNKNRTAFLEELKDTNTYICDDCNKRHIGKPNIRHGSNSTTVRCDACQKNTDDYYEMMQRSNERFLPEETAYYAKIGRIESINKEIDVLENYSTYYKTDPNLEMYHGHEQKKLYEIRHYEVKDEISYRENKLKKLDNV